MGQGALAIETRADDTVMHELLAFLNNTDSFYATTGERAFLRTVEGGCQVPVGVYGTVENDLLELEAVIATVDGKTIIRDKIKGETKTAEFLGEELARKMLAAGGLKIMTDLGCM